MPWSPILSSRGASRAREIIDAIYHGVSTDSCPPSRLPARAQYEDAILYCYLSLAKYGGNCRDEAVACLNAAIENAPGSKGALGLFGGLCGLGWAVEHVSAALTEAPSGETCAESEGDAELDVDEEIDQLVIDELGRGPWAGPYDLISGLVGLGAYFLERLPAEPAVRGLTAILDQLEGMSMTTDAGITWLTGPELLPASQREHWPAGYYNLGVAHGIPGIIHLLSEMCAAGVQEERAKRLLEGSVGWLIAQQRPRGCVSRFSSWLAPGESSDSRLAWCYGDLGILGILLQVARRTGRHDWQEFAHSLLDHCLAWPPERAGVIDAPLCHGAAGIAHIFNRIYQTEGDSRCREAALAWFERAFDMRMPGQGAGGFFAYARPDPNGPAVWDPTFSFLAGAIGIALAALSALTDVEPNWDRMLLLSGRAWPDR